MKGESHEAAEETNTATDAADTPEALLPYWARSAPFAAICDPLAQQFANAAVLWDAPLALAADETLTLRHRVLVHDGAWESERIDAAWHDWATTPPTP